MIGGAFVHHLRRSKTLAPVDDGDLARESGEKGGLLHRRVTATDHDNLLLAEESSVTGRAGGDPSTLVLVLALDAEPDGLRTGADDDSLGSELLAFDPDPKRPLGEVDPLDVLVVNLQTEALGLLAHVNHHLRASYAGGISREVLHIGGQHELAAGHVTSEH